MRFGSIHGAASARLRPARSRHIWLLSQDAPEGVHGGIGPGMTRALVVALVLTVLFTGMPLLMVTPMMSCADCDLASMVGASCILAVLAALVAVAAVLLGVPLRSRPSLRNSLLAASGLERPPRLA